MVSSREHIQKISGPLLAQVDFVRDLHVCSHYCFHLGLRYRSYCFPYRVLIFPHVESFIVIRVDCSFPFFFVPSISLLLGHQVLFLVSDNFVANLPHELYLIISFIFVPLPVQDFISIFVFSSFIYFLQYFLCHPRSLNKIY